MNNDYITATPAEDDAMIDVSPHLFLWDVYRRVAGCLFLVVAPWVAITVFVLVLLRML